MINSLLIIFAQSSGVDPGCKKYFFGLPHWYKYLNVSTANDCAPELTGLNDFWLIGLALIELLLRLAVLIAIAYVVWSGIRYSESRGNVEKATKAKNTLIDAITGLLIAMVAVAIISFIGSSFTE